MSIAWSRRVSWDRRSKTSWEKPQRGAGVGGKLELALVISHRAHGVALAAELPVAVLPHFFTRGSSSPSGSREEVGKSVDQRRPGSAEFEPDWDA